MLGKIFSRRHVEIHFFLFFFYFSQKTNMTLHADCLQRRQFAWNVKFCFLGKIRKKNIVSLSSAALAHGLVTVKESRSINNSNLTHRGVSWQFKKRFWFKHNLFYLYFAHSSIYLHKHYMSKAPYKRIRKKKKDIQLIWIRSVFR